MLLQFCHTAIRAAEDEAPTGLQILPVLIERVGVGHHFVLPPLDVRLVLGLQIRTGLALGAFVVLADVDLLHHGQLGDLRQTGLGTCLVEHRGLAHELGEVGVRIDRPGVGDARGALHGRVGVRRQPDRRARRLCRQHREALVDELVAKTLGRHSFALEQALHDVEFVEEDADLLLWDAERIELLRAVPKTDAEDEAPTGDGVKRGRVLGELDRIEQREQCDVRGDAHVAGIGRDAREQRHQLRHLKHLGEEVLARRNEIKTEVATERGVRDSLLDDRMRRHGVRLLHVEEDADPGLAHSPCSFVRPGRMRRADAA